MQNTTKGNYFFEKNINGSSRLPRRTSTSGFEYPKDLCSVQYPCNFHVIPEMRCQNIVPANMIQTPNGDYDKRFRNSFQASFSENCSNTFNRTIMTSNTFDSRLYNNEPSPIPRFSSTQLIGPYSTENDNSQSNLCESKAITGHTQPFFPTVTPNVPPNMYNSRQVNTNFQMPPNGGALQYLHPSLLVYDMRTGTYQSVLFYPPGVAVAHSGQEINGNNEVVINDYQKGLELPSQEPFDLNEDFLPCQLNMAEHNLEMDVFPEFVNNDLLYFLPQELPNNISDINRTESQSMPSLHGDDSVESDFETSDDDQLNTVYGEEMLKELQKMSSVFTNVINLPMSHHPDVVGSNVFPCHNNLSRFKKTRIKERTTFWRTQIFTVKDNLVKIIPNEVLNIKPMDTNRMDKFEAEVLECQISKQTEIRSTGSDPPECIHSSYRCRSTPIDIRHLKHSNRINQKYRSSLNSHSHSPNDPNQRIPSSISSRHSHRKSMQVPVRIPVVWNPIIPLISPAVQPRNKMFFEQPNIFSSKNPRKKRRWSVCGTKFEKSNVINSAPSQHVRPNGEFSHGHKRDCINEYFDGRRSPNMPNLYEYSQDHTSQISANIESTIDGQLMELKRMVMSCIESNVSEMREEIKSLQITHADLEKQMGYYKARVNVLEEAVRQNVPKWQWDLYGIKEDTLIKVEKSGPDL